MFCVLCFYTFCKNWRIYGLFHQKSLFCFWDIQFSWVPSSSPLFSMDIHWWVYRRSWLKILNSKVYGDPICLKRNLTNSLTNCLISSIVKNVWSWKIVNDKVLYKEKFWWKICWKCALETSSRPVFNFVTNQPKI